MTFCTQHMRHGMHSDGGTTTCKSTACNHASYAPTFTLFQESILPSISSLIIVAPIFVALSIIIVRTLIALPSII